MDENVLQRLLALYATTQSNAAPPQEMFMRSGPQGFALPPPQFSMQSSPHQNTTSPRFSGGVNVPAFGGTVGLSGDYQANQYGPGVPDWSAMMRYRREF